MTPPPPPTPLQIRWILSEQFPYKIEEHEMRFEDQIVTAAVRNDGQTDQPLCVKSEERKCSLWKQLGLVGGN